MICRYKIKFISDIEQKIRKLLVNIAVAPFVGVWIEIPYAGTASSLSAILSAILSMSASSLTMIVSASFSIL